MSASETGRSTVNEILERTLVDGERLSDSDALTLLESRELIRIGRAANEIRSRKNDPGRVTFVVDRNINYTDYCVSTLYALTPPTTPWRRCASVPA